MPLLRKGLGMSQELNSRAVRGFHCKCLLCGDRGLEVEVVCNFINTAVRTDDPFNIAAKAIANVKPA